MTPTATFTPSSTPTYIPRTVETPAQPFHNQSARFGIPTPFGLWPVLEENQYQNGYGPNGFSVSAFSECDVSPTIPPTPLPGNTPEPSIDLCQYRFTNRIHPGVDYFTDPYESRVVALCDGIIVPGRTAGGGTAADNAGEGLSLRCFANDPPDPDGDGNPNLSNVIVVYNHLVLGQDIQPAATNGLYQIVSANQVLGSTAGYTTRTGVDVLPHLDLQVYIAYGYRSNEGAVQLNPRLMFSDPRPLPEDERYAYPNGYDTWWLQGKVEDASNVSFWTNDEDAVFLRNVVTYLEYLDTLPDVPIFPYRYPNCELSSDMLHCATDQDDLDLVLPTPTDAPQSP
jgi:hypothetical protein